MKTTHKTILAAVIAAVILLTALPGLAEDKQDEGRRRRHHKRGPDQEMKQHHKMGQRRGMGPQDRPGKGMMRPRFTEYLEWLEKNYPEKAEELKKLKEDNRQVYRKKVGYGMKKHRRIMEAEKENPELAKVLKESMELNQQRNKLAKKIYHTEDEKEKQKLTKQLEGLLSEKFDLVLKRKELELEQLQKRLEQLKRQLKSNRENIEKWKDSKFKEQKIKERLERLTTRKKEEFRWD